MKIRVLTIKELSDYLAQSVAYDPILQNLHIEGEISNFKIHSGGNIYFTLKDDVHKIRCILFADSYRSVQEFDNIADGDHVLCRGSVSYYKREGYASIIVTRIEKVGASRAYEEFLELKAKLEKQGLFDEKYKKPLPRFPKRIGVVTSKTGAVIQDIYHVIKRRYPAVEIVLYSAHVQGKIAVDEVSEGIRRLNKEAVDLIIVARGGGSYEELSAFNSEKVAYAIFESDIPVISAVGHETDFTIADFVADVRASTPSVAAELSVPQQSDILQYLSNHRQLLQTQLQFVLQQKRKRLEQSQQQLTAHSPQRLLEVKVHRLAIRKERLRSCVSNLYFAGKSRLEQSSKKLFAKNPQIAFEYGAAFLYNANHERITSVSQIQEQMLLDVQMKDGKFTVSVVKK